MPDTLDCAVIGAGVVGLAVARELARAGREVVILEAADAFGTGASSRNSEVIHAGIYYPPGSLKGRLCVAGRRMLYDYCASRGVAHRRLGKLIVAVTADEIPMLDDYLARGRANGVDDLVRIGRDEARRLEPEVVCVDALLSPSTGIVDSHGLMLALLGEAESAGAMLALLSPVESGRVTEDGIELRVGGAAESTLLCRTVVNAAGLGAQRVATGIAGFPRACIPALALAKGHYFTLAGRSPFSRLVYPVAGGGGLGVHVTLDLAGQARFGPDVAWIAAIDYRFDEGRAGAYYGAIRRYWPGLKDGALAPGYTGIRPKISGPGEPARDFVIEGPADHGVPGLVNLFGIESPGLTASLAIAGQVAALLGAG